nr:hypothetical protein [Tanacetum cinerariifolium]
MNELEQIKKEKEGLDSKLTGFKFASKDLDTLLESQRSDKNKEGLGYSVVPPPPAQVYSPPKKDINSSVSVDGESSESILPKPMIKFVKAGDSPKIIKTHKVETARKSFVRYAKMYRNTSKSPNVRASVSAARRVNTAAPRPNVNSARPKTTQDLVIIKLIQSVKRRSLSNFQQVGSVSEGITVGSDSVVTVGSDGDE